MQSQEFETPAQALAHYGKKGMRWGVRNEPGTSDSRSAAKSEVKEVGSKAAEIIRESRRAPDEATRSAAADRYETEVLARIQSPDFKAAYQKASTMGKGEMAAHAVLLGPLAAVTIPVARMNYTQIREKGYDLEVDVAHDILREMRQP